MSDSEGEQVKPPPEPKLFKILLCPVNTKTGKAIIDSLDYPYDNNQEDRNLILGSESSSPEVETPKQVRKIIDLEDLDSFTRVLRECDVIIFDVFKVDLKIIEYSIKTLKYEKLDKEKTLILISSVRVWAKTPSKIKKEEEEEAEEDDVEEDPGDGEGEEDEAESEPEPEPEEDKDKDKEGDEEQVQKFEYLPFRERDFILRRTYAKYSKIKSIETMCLSAGKSVDRLHSYVVCTGVPYGLGEEVFFPIFRDAWLQNPPYITVYGKGLNKIPTIHYRDIALHIKFLVYKLPKSVNYVFAIDHAKNRTQKKIMKAIGKGIGQDQVKKVDVTDSDWFRPDFDLIMLDLWMKPSKIFNWKPEGEEEQEEEPEEEEEEGADAKPKKKSLKLKFDWVSKAGPAKNILKLCKEFNDVRELRPNKILVTGPPNSGLSHYSEKLANFYNIPLIRIADVVATFRARTKQEDGKPDEFVDELRAHLEEEKAKMVDEAREALEKQKNQGIKGLPEDVNEDDYIPRMSTDFLLKWFKWRLSQNDCLNRGYVLDNFPRSFAQCASLFTDPKEGEEEAADEEEEPERVLNKLNKPDSVIFLSATEDYIKNLLSNLTEEHVKGTHYNFQAFTRRYNLWKEFNFTEDDGYILKDFFTKWNIDLIESNLDDNMIDHLQSMKIFIERNGKYQNYQTHEAEKELERMKTIEAEEQKKKNAKLEHIRLRDEEERDQLLLQKEEIRLKMIKLRKEDQEILDKKSFYLKTYFKDNLQSIMKEAVLDLAGTMPDDPISHLADYLFKNAYKVPEAARGDI